MPEGPFETLAFTGIESVGRHVEALHPEQLGRRQGALAGGSEHHLATPTKIDGDVRVERQPSVRQPLRVRDRVKVRLERIELTGPLRSIWLQPRVELFQRLRAKSVHPPLSVMSDLHQPGVAQHLEVTRHAGLMHADLLDEVVDRPFAFADSVEDPSSGRLSDHLEDVERSGHGLKYTVTHIYVQTNIIRMIA